MQQSHSNPNKNIAVVICEDRPNYQVAIKLLISSLEANNPEVDIHVFAPNATVDFQDWMDNRHAYLHLQIPTELKGWNVKPPLLLWALDQGYDRCIWMDCDMILSKPLPKVMFDQPKDVLVASELPFHKFDIHSRTIAWNLEPGRTLFLRDPSSCCTLVTDIHRPFILQWIAMLKDPRYQNWQARPSKERPREFYGCDAPYQALIGSENYDNLRVKLLKHGQDIAQCLTPGSYTMPQRLMSLSNGLPPIIHAMGKKPWLATDSERIYQAVSPYACVARSYKEQLTNKEQEWLELPKHWISLWHNLVKGNPALSSLPFAI